ncbi:hypothetical protein GCM10020258_35130 [Sphingomonas yabuuchiae]
MKPFTYERAKDAVAAARAANKPGAKFLAGGTNLLDLMKIEVETPTHLIDVQELKLDRIEKTKDGGLRIGAFVTNTALAADERVRRDYGVLSRAIVAGRAGSYATRRRRRAICSNGRAAPISTTPIWRATNASPAAGAALSGAIRANWRSSAPAATASPPTPAT